MRTDITNISIPTPCQEAWNKMTPSADGRFCGSCAKTVTDFSAMSADQIIFYLSMAQNTCGRFNSEQLAGMNSILLDQPSKIFNIWKSMVLAITVFSATQQIAKAQATTTPVKTEQVPVENILGKVVISEPDTAGRRVFKGTVRDSVDKFALPGATVYIDGKAVAGTNANGEFLVTAPKTASVLTIRFIGYAETTIAIKGRNENEPINILLKEGGGRLMGEVVITRAPLHKRIYHRFIKRPIKKIFN